MRTDGRTGMPPGGEMADQLGEGARAGSLAIAQDPRHRQLGVVVKDRQRYPAEKGKGRNVPVQKRFRRLRRIGLHKRRVGMGRSKQNTCITVRTPPMMPMHWPKSTWAWPGGWANGTKASLIRVRFSRT